MRQIDGYQSVEARHMDSVAKCGIYGALKDNAVDSRPSGLAGRFREVDLRLWMTRRSAAKCTFPKGPTYLVVATPAVRNSLVLFTTSSC